MFSQLLGTGKKITISITLRKTKDYKLRKTNKQTKNICINKIVKYFFLVFHYSSAINKGPNSSKYVYFHILSTDVVFYGRDTIFYLFGWLEFHYWHYCPEPLFAVKVLQPLVGMPLPISRILLTCKVNSAIWLAGSPSPAVCNYPVFPLRRLHRPIYF